MSKVFKSKNVTVGPPKTIINTFKEIIKQAGSNESAEPEENLSPEESSGDIEEKSARIIEDAKQMYLKIIQEANSEAQTITENAEAEAQKLMSDAKEEGYSQGYESGYQEGRNAAQAVIDEAVDIREFLDSRKESYLKEIEGQVMELVLKIAEKVIGMELSQNKDSILSLVEQALQKCAFRKKLVLKVSPDDYDFINESKDRICMMVEGISGIDIESDLSLTQGSCIIETPSGEINSSIDVQIQEVERIFAYLLRNE